VSSVKPGNVGLRVSKSIGVHAFAINALDHIDSAWFFSLLVIVKRCTVLSYSKGQRFLLPTDSIAALMIVRNRVRNLVMTCELANARAIVSSKPSKT
jgi:hypothetical protein